ncbi:ribosomal RNA small subunit methyltransferase A [Patescibacteria group bacterium]|nr:ribosomal RNA small subunit methyltransferase A [Patescibacteria group bacterium]
MLPDNLLKWTKVLIAKYQLKPGRRLGQHFLIDRSVIEEVLTVADLKPNQAVLEVGGGFGTLTLFLLEKKVNLTVVELDKKLASILEGYKKFSTNFKVVEADILKISDTELKQALNLSINQSWFLLANLPYEISGAFLRRFLSGSFKPSRMVLLLQKEVADRLAAKPGQLSLLGLQAQLNAQVQVFKKVTPAAFLPPPKVGSAVVRLDIKSAEDKTKLLAGLSEDFFWRVAKTAFTTKRKQLVGSLSAGLALDRAFITQALHKVNLKTTARPQELSLEQWIGLSKELVIRFL